MRADVARGLDVNMVYVLLGLDRLANRLAEYGAQFRGCLLPLGAAESFGANDELAFGRDGDDHLRHICLLRTGRGW